MKNRYYAWHFILFLFVIFLITGCSQKEGPTNPEVTSKSIDKQSLNPGSFNPNTDIVISYFYSYIQTEPLIAVVHPRETLTIYDELGGCGPIYRDIAKCEVSNDGQIRAYNHDCLSGPGPGTYGPWVSSGCSTAEEYGYIVECCILEEVTICHKPGTPAQKTLIIPIQALPGHLAHGDTLGSCEGNSAVNHYWE